MMSYIRQTAYCVKSRPEANSRSFFIGFCMRRHEHHDHRRHDRADYSRHQNYERAAPGEGYRPWGGGDGGWEPGWRPDYLPPPPVDRYGWAPAPPPFAELYDR